MNLRALWNDDNLIWEALFLSAAIHFMLSHLGNMSFQFHEKHTVEIDITNMGHMGMPGGGRRAAAPQTKPAAPPKEWVKPAPNQKVIPATIPTQPVSAPAPEEQVPPVSSGPPGNGGGEYGIGTGDGSANALSRIPQVLNLSDLRTILKKFYPEEARINHVEGAVTLDLHIDTDGHVQAIDIVRSGGSEFDNAAKQVAKLLRFTPAFVGSQRVAVKMRQTIQFKLEEQ